MADEPAVAPPNGAAPAPKAPEAVPYDRFQAVVAAKNEASARISALQAEVQALSEKAATVDTLSGQVNEWKSKAEAAEGKWGRWQSIAAGLGTADQEAVEAAEWAYNRLPAKARPKLGDWLAQIREKPAEAPKVLHPWLSTEQAGPGAAEKPPPRPPPRGATPPGAPSAITAEQIREAKNHGVRTGDWSRYRELAEAAGLRRKS